MIFLQATGTPNPQDFFTWGSFATLAGATGIVYTVCGVVQSVFNFSPKWFALAFSILVSFIGVFIRPDTDVSQTIPGSVKYFIAFLNGFLIYSSAVGSNQIINKKVQPPSVGPRNVIPVKRKFNSNWWQ